MRTIKSVYWRIRIALFALRWVFATNLGDRVRYQGRMWIVINGVKPGMWDLADIATRHLIEAPRDECRKILWPSDLWRSYRSGYRFYMTSWHRIWVNQGIQPWVRALDIWNKS